MKAKPAHRGRTRPALLLVDFINPMDFAGAAVLAPRAVAAATAAAHLKSRLKRARVPVIYANDNFGDWRADFSTIIEACRGAFGLHLRGPLPAIPRCSRRWAAAARR